MTTPGGDLDDQRRRLVCRHANDAGGDACDAEGAGYEEIQSRQENLLAYFSAERLDVGANSLFGFCDRKSDVLLRATVTASHACSVADGLG